MHDSDYVASAVRDASANIGREIELLAERLEFAVESDQQRDAIMNVLGGTMLAVVDELRIPGIEDPVLHRLERAGACFLGEDPPEKPRLRLVTP